MIADLILTPDDLDAAPELASLAVLDVAIQTTRAALLSIHAEIRNPQDSHPDHDTGIIRTLLILADALGDQIAVYCEDLERRQQRERRTIANRDF
jgi:hypothetical protein